jgi:hypothetical protein
LYKLHHSASLLQNTLHHPVLHIMAMAPGGKQTMLTHLNKLNKHAAMGQDDPLTP